MKKIISIGIIFIAFSLVSCSNKTSNNEISSQIKEEISQSNENIEEIITPIPQEEYEIVSYWISRDELSTLNVYKNNDKMFFNLNSISVKKFSRCILSENLIEFPSDGIDFIEYTIENDSLKFTYKDEKFSFIKASERDFNKTNEKISKYLDEQQINPGNNGTSIKENIYGYWIASNEKVAMILNENGIADITTKNSSIGEKFTIDKNSITFENLGKYEISMGLDKKTMLLIQDDTICFTFTKYSSIDSFFEEKNNIFNDVINILDETQETNTEETLNNEFQTEIKDNPKSDKKIENPEQ